MVPLGALPDDDVRRATGEGGLGVLANSRTVLAGWRVVVPSCSDEDLANVTPYDLHASCENLARSLNLPHEKIQRGPGMTIDNSMRQEPKFVWVLVFRCLVCRHVCVRLDGKPQSRAYVRRLVLGREALLWSIQQSVRPRWVAHLSDTVITDCLTWRI